MSTNWISKSKITRSWFIINAETCIKTFFMHSFSFNETQGYLFLNLDCGDNFIVINADKVKMTGNKLRKNV